MPPKKKKGEKAAPPEETVEDAIKRFVKEYKTRCDVACCIPVESVVKGVQVEGSGPGKLTWLVLNKERLSPINLEALVGACCTLFPNSLSVKHLTLWGCGLGDTGMQLVLPLLSPPVPQIFPTPQLPMQQLEQLDIIEDGVTSQGAALLAEVLRCNNFLKSLQLTYNNIGDEGIQALCTKLMAKEGEGTLEVLNLECCGLGPEGFAVLAEFLKHEKCALKELNLKANHAAGQPAVQALLQAVQGSATLSVLNVRDTFKRREDAAEFHAVLKDTLLLHPTLSDLDLSANAVIPEEATVLVAALQMNRNITSIKVDRDLDAPGEDAPKLYTEINTLSAENLALKIKASKSSKKKKKK